MNMFIAFILIVFGLLALIAAVLLALGHKPQLIFDIYPSKNIFYRIKYCIALWLLRHLRLRLYDPSKREKSAEELEQPRQLGEHPASYDVISFIGSSKQNQLLFIYLERRRRGVLKICFYIWLPNEGLLCLPKLPDMAHFSTDGKLENTEFRGSGFYIFPEQYLRRWRIRYDGPLRHSETGKVVNVKMDLVFSCKKDYFDYNRDLSTEVISDAVAREAWDMEFVNMVLSVEKFLEKRMHYDQVGSLSGNLDIDHEKILILDMKGYKDHNFGTERLLAQINRFVLISLFLENGTTLIMGNISQPTFLLSSLKIGYICTVAGEYQPITETNFELYAYGEKGTPPLHQNFIVATSTQKYFVQIEARHTAVHYIGGNWESKIFNQFVTCKVNGISGNGITEFLYRHDGGRTEEVGLDDPDWYKQIRHFERSRGEFVDDFGDFDLLDGF